MRKYEERVHTSKSQVLVELTCDLCGAKAKNRDDWGSGHYERDEVDVEVRVRREKSETYGGEGTQCITFVDLCPNCFEEKLVPWLKSQGATIQTKENDW